MILLFIVPYRKNGIEALTKYITEITTARVTIINRTNDLLDYLYNKLPDLNRKSFNLY